MLPILYEAKKGIYSGDYLSTLYIPIVCVKARCAACDC